MSRNINAIVAQNNRSHFSGILKLRLPPMKENLLFFLMKCHSFAFTKSSRNAEYQVSNVKSRAAFVLAGDFFWTVLVSGYLFVAFIRQLI